MEATLEDGVVMVTEPRIHISNSNLNSRQGYFNRQIKGKPKTILFVAIVALLVIGEFVVVPLRNGSRPQPNQEECHSVECRETAARIIESMDTRIDPCVDFYEFTCGKWINKNQRHIVEEKQAHRTTFQIVADKINANLQVILAKDEEPEDLEVLKQARLFYNSCIMSANKGIQSSAYSELKLFTDDLFTGFENVSSLESPEFARLLGKIRRELGGAIIVMGQNKPYRGGNYLFSIEVDVDDVGIENETNLPKYKPQIRPATHMPDMLEFPPSLLPHMKNFTVYSIYRWWQFRNNGEKTSLTILAMANRIAELEAALIDAKAHFKNSEMNGREVSPDDLNNLTQNTFYITAFFQELFSKTDTLFDFKTLKLTTAEIQYIKVLIDCLRNFSMIEIKNYLRWRIFFDLAIRTNAEFRDILRTFEFISFPAVEPSPKVCTDQTVRYFNDPLTHSYMKQYMNFTEETIREADKMVKNIKEEFEYSLMENTWLKSVDIDLVRNKVKNMRVQLGYSNYTDDFRNNKSEYIHKRPELCLNPKSSFLQNMIEVIRFDSLEELRRIGTDKNYNEWHGSQLESNAFNVLEFNTIVLPAGILQSPFCGNPMNYLNYGAIGFIIGHELSHGFDTTAFEDRSKCFISQYNEYLNPDCNLHVDGNKTLGENISDNTGLRLSFKAYKNYVQREGPEKTLPKLPYTPDQLFFISFGQSWCETYNEDSCRLLHETDVHTRARFRVKGSLQNLEEFHMAFSCPLPKADNICSIW